MRSQYFGAIRVRRAARAQPRRRRAPSHTPHACRQDGKLDTLRWCLRHGGMSIRAEDDGGHTGVQLAAASGNAEVLEVLIDHVLKVGEKADLEAEDDDGRTPLMMASHNGKLECARLLVLRGKARVDAKSESGKTARDYALSRKHEKVAAFLADPTKPVEEEESEEEEETQVQKPKVFKASLKLESEKNKQHEVHEARVRAAEELQAHLASAPAAEWEEVASVLAETRRELSLRGKAALAGSSPLDPAIWRCVCLFELRIELANGALTAVPPQLGLLRDLTTLILSHNNLDHLPAEIGDLSKLKNLEVRPSPIATASAPRPHHPRPSVTGRWRRIGLKSCRARSRSVARSRWSTSAPTGSPPPRRSPASRRSSP